jgi:Flp pilus assembly protein TadG
MAGPPFLLLLLVTMQFSLQMYTQCALDYAIDLATRQIRLGTITSAPSDVQNNVCTNFFGSSTNCQQQLTITSSSGPSFGAQSGAVAVSGSFVMIKAQYNLPYIALWLAQIMGQADAAITSTFAFQNEPY